MNGRGADQIAVIWSMNLETESSGRAMNPHDRASGEESLTRASGTPTFFKLTHYPALGSGSVHSHAGIDRSPSVWLLCMASEPYSPVWLDRKAIEPWRT